ncbi:hypothetical protein H920_04237 [Fukomys damarensis]|uniref:Uncharacterized protein n=1 Tax=Fukomys damarensis TaxID=885580 RepID=A0A091DQF1_FUKDA|nr:hypothetical protein H920_04237 [Fukomys damarensis]
MVDEKLVDIFEISRSMFMYPWLEYPDRTKDDNKQGYVAPNPGQRAEYSKSIGQVLDTLMVSHSLQGCMNKRVVHALIQQLKEESKVQGMETLTRLRMALNSWASDPEDKRTQVRNEEELVLVLQTLMKSSSGEAALEAALCLGFLRPCSNMAQEFLLQCLCQGTKTQQMKALRMLVKIMHVHSAVVTRAILAQLCSSSVIEDRFEATQMLRTIGLEQIKAQGLEKLTFDLLKWKTHYEPFFVRP